MSPKARSYFAVAAAVVVLATVTALLFTRPLRASRGARLAATPQLSPVERGEYLVRAVACQDCHTPLIMGPNGPQPDPARMLAGHPENFVDPYTVQLPETPGFWMWAPTNTAFYGVWGKSYAINLTPDENTGIGVWSEDIFVKALRTGQHWGTSRPILPPMPWQWISQMTDEDLKAMYAYLRTIPPVHNRVPEAEPIG